MLRFIARTTIALIANAVGLIVAASILDDMTLSASSLFLDVVIFTALATLGSFLYNLDATMLGGLEITLAED